MKPTYTYKELQERILRLEELRLETEDVKLCQELHENAQHLRKLAAELHPQNIAA